MDDRYCEADLTLRMSVMSTETVVHTGLKRQYLTEVFIWSEHSGNWLIPAFQGEGRDEAKQLVQTLSSQRISVQDSGLRQGRLSPILQRCCCR